MVAGVLHTHAWLQWPTTLMLDPLQQSAVAGGAALAITVFWGTSFTLMLMGTYEPAATKLSAQAQHLIKQEQQKGTVQDQQAWLKEHDLSITLGEQLP